MQSTLLSTDVFATLHIKDYIFIGMGHVLYVYRKCDAALAFKLSALYPDKIHGIVRGPEKTLAVFGARSLRILEYELSGDVVRVKESCSVSRFADWIIAVHWLRSTKEQLLILFAHNNLLIYNLRNEPSRNIQCEEKCILYGGSISGECIENSVVFAGTVFQEILVWTVRNEANNEKDVPVLHRLKGHNGVILSAIYDPTLLLVCSTSDDRTVRLWKVKNAFENEKRPVDWENVEIALTTTMYGHVARVWKALIRNNVVVSIGEDSLICIWSIDGELLDKINAHRGAAIWTIDIAKDVMISGASNGAVYIWPFKQNVRSELYHLTSPYDERTISKYIVNLSRGGALVFAEGGKLLHYDKGNTLPSEAIDLPKYTNYWTMRASPSRKLVSLASDDGHVIIYQDTTDEGPATPLRQIAHEKVMESKIFSLLWLSEDEMLLCGARGSLKMIGMTSDGAIAIKSEFLLPLCREYLVTVAARSGDLLICGDRAGSIHVFVAKRNTDDESGDTSAKMLNPVQSFLKIHGRMGVQSCTLMDGKILTTGRDGTLRYFASRPDQFGERLQLLLTKRMPMDWVTGTLEINGDLCVLGFKEIDFIIYSTTLERALMRVPCGGGHRSWDCTLTNGSINFAYIRDKRAHLAIRPLSSLSLLPILNGFHAKEVLAIRPLPCIGHNVVISGGEDNTLRVSCITELASLVGTHDFRTLVTLDGHISSVRAIAVINIEYNESRSKNLVFSGGGRAQLKVSAVEIEVEQDALGGKNVSATELASYMLMGTDRQRCRFQGSNRNHRTDPETRYMDISAHRCPGVGVGHNRYLAHTLDGIIRYDIANHRAQLVGSVFRDNRCILKVHSFVHESDLIVLTMATDGRVNFWNFTDTVGRISEYTEDAEKEIGDTVDAPFASLKLHQSGINSFDWKVEEDDSYLLATGGDDNLLNLVSCRLMEDETGVVSSLMVVAKWCSSNFHSTQITGLRFDGTNKLFSVGIDQRLIVFTYNRSDDDLSVSSVDETITAVSDVQGMTLCRAKPYETLICIYGRGFEIIRETRADDVACNL